MLARSQSPGSSLTLEAIERGSMLQMGAVQDLLKRVAVQRRLGKALQVLSAAERTGSTTTLAHLSLQNLRRLHWLLCRAGARAFVGKRKTATILSDETGLLMGREDVGGLAGLTMRDQEVQQEATWTRGWTREV